MGNISEMRVMMYDRQSTLVTKSRAKVSRIFQRFGLRKPVMKNPVKSIGKLYKKQDPDSQAGKNGNALTIKPADTRFRLLSGRRARLHLPELSNPRY